MAEKEAEKEGEGEAKGGGSKKLIIFAVLAVLLIGGGVGAFFAMSGSENKENAEEGGDGEAAAAEGEEGGAEEAAKPAIMPLDPFIVNLQVKGSFLKTTIQLEFAEPVLPPTVEHDLPLIRDAIIQVLSAKSAADILTIEGKQKLREELRDGINESLGAEDVVEVYFTEFIVQ